MSLSVPDLKNKTDWKRSEGVEAVGCGLDLPGSNWAVRHGRRFILSDEAGEALVRPGATRGGERAGPTSHPGVSVGARGAVWGLTGIREAQGCGFNCF